MGANAPFFIRALKSKKKDSANEYILRSFHL